MPDAAHDVASADERGSQRSLIFGRIHRGLPADAPWLFRVVLRSRAFLAFTVIVSMVGVVVLWRWCRASALTLGALAGSAVFADIVLKLIVDRQRPANPVVSTALGSFPSGHVIHAVVLFGLVPFILWAFTGRRRFLQWGFVLFAVVTFAVAISRVALGAHWPSDVIVSFLIGASLLLGAEQMLTSAWASSRCSTLGLHGRTRP